MNLVPLSPLHKGTIVSAPSPLLFEALHVTWLRVVLGRYQRRSLTLFAFVQAYVAEVIRYNNPSALTEYLKQKLRLQRAKRLGRSLPAQVEQSVQLERNSVG